MALGSCSVAVIRVCMLAYASWSLLGLGGTIGSTNVDGSCGQKYNELLFHSKYSGINLYTVEIQLE